MFRKTLAVGATLIFQACSQDQSHPLLANFSPAPTDDGRPGYTLYLPKETWQFVARHKGITDAELDARVHVQVTFMVNQSMRAEHGVCPDRWLYSAVAPTSDGGVVFSLFCASDEELKAEATRADRSWKVAT